MVHELETKKVRKAVEKAREPDKEEEMVNYPPVADGLFAVSSRNPVIPVSNRITAMPVYDRGTARRQYKEIKAAREDLDPPPPEKKAKHSENYQLLG